MCWRSDGVTVYWGLVANSCGVEYSRCRLHVEPIS